jgi:hypothetical protein
VWSCRQRVNCDDHLGRQVQQNLPAERLWNSSGAIAPMETTQYDGDGNMVQQVDGNGAVIADSVCRWRPASAMRATASSALR